MSGDIHIHAPETLRKRIVPCERCPDCKGKTLLLSFFQEWYGWHSTCIKCGRQFEDGEWIPLEFARGVRKANVASAKARWRNTRNQPMPQPHYPHGAHK